LEYEEDLEDAEDLEDEEHLEDEEDLEDLEEEEDFEEEEDLEEEEEEEASSSSSVLDSPISVEEEGSSVLGSPVSVRIIDEKLLPPKFKYVSVLDSPISVGMEPVRSLPSRFNSTKRGKDTKRESSVPVSWLWELVNERKAYRTPSSEGISPPIWLLSNQSCSSPDALLDSGSSLFDKGSRRLLSSTKLACIMPTSKPSSDGMTPVSCTKMGRSCC